MSEFMGVLHVKHIMHHQEELDAVSKTGSTGDWQSLLVHLNPGFASTFE
jgi:hypothetical protein